MTTDLLDPDAVTNRESFLRFVQALITDRETAEHLEKTDPDRHQWGGANDWQNSSISAFLAGALSGAQDQEKWGEGTAPSWRELAIFLLLGKIYE
jgi:hypothetical protein